MKKNPPNSRKNHPRSRVLPLVGSALRTASSRSNTAILILLLLGLLLWLLLPAGPAGSHASLPPWRWIIAALSAILASLPPIQTAAKRLTKPLQNPSIKTRAILTVIITLAASSYLLLTALNQDRDLFPKTHDESSYLIQMRMLATGRFCLPRHPLADFFDSFYLLSTPVYASMYFPGTALMFAPALWLHWPLWLLPILVAGTIVGLIYRLITEYVDGVMGLLAVILLLSLSWFRMLSIMLMSQLPLLFLGLVMIWACSRSRGTGRQVGWIILIGACAGWAAITRPLDALCFTIPVAVVLAWDLRRQTTFRRSLVIAALIAGASPFLALQLTLNRAVTGSILQTPFDLNARRDFPRTSYGFHPISTEAKPQSIVPQKQLLYSKWVRPFIADHQVSHIIADQCRRRIPLIADVTLPARVLLILLPVGLLGLTQTRRWLLFAPFPLLIIGYVGYTFFLEHYAVVMAPAIILVMVLAVRVLGACWPSLTPGLIAMIVSLSLTNLHEFNRNISDEPFHSTWLRQLHDSTETNAIVLFTFDLDPADPDLISKISQEPVYNTDVASPDDAPLIRAHDLGPRNIELFRYYATRAPDRMIYRFSRKTGQLDTLGRAADLYSKGQAP